MGQPKEIFVKNDRCVGCRSCVMACAVERSASKSLFGGHRRISKSKEPHLR